MRANEKYQTEAKAFFSDQVREVHYIICLSNGQCKFR